MKKTWKERKSISRRRRGVRLFVLIAVVALVAVPSAGCGSQHAVSNLFASDGALEIDSPSEGRYAYETLDSDTKLVYDQLVYAFDRRRKDVRIASSKKSVLKKAYQAVRYDHPEFFWVKGLKYEIYKNGDTISAIDIIPQYNMSRRKQKSYQKKIDQTVDKFLKSAPKNGSDYEKVKYCYKTLIRNVDYDSNARYSQTILSTFVYKKTVCKGYSYGLQYMLRKLGVACTTVEGKTHNINHSWNLVRMDGAYYYVDVTWGNSQYIYYLNGEKTGSKTEKYINYSYLGADTTDIEQTHVASDVISLPECTADKDNYFVKEGLYFSEFDRDQIGKAVKEKYRNKESSVQLKFSSEDLLEEAIQYFAADYHISDYIPRLKTFRYVENTETMTLLIIFPEN